MNVDPRLLEPFVVLAEELHFTRAAERLHIAQPALSRQIARLETQLGGALFSREPQGVRLTPMGKVLLSHVAPGLRKLDAGFTAARELISGESGELRVGFLSSLAAPAIPLIAAAYSEPRPRVELRMSEASLGRQLDELRAGHINVALFSDFDGVRFDAAGLRLDRFARGPQFVALSEGHPMAGASSIALRDLAGEPFVMPSGTDGAGYRGAVLAVARRSGLDIKPGPAADNVGTMLGLVAAGFGVTMVAWPAALAPRPQIVFVPLIDESVEIVAARPDKSSAAAEEFVATAKRVLNSLVPVT